MIFIYTRGDKALTDWQFLAVANVVLAVCLCYSISEEVNDDGYKEKIFT